MLTYTEENVKKRPAKKRRRKYKEANKPLHEGSSETSAEIEAEAAKKSTPFMFPFPKHKPSESKIPNISGYTQEEVLFYMGLAIYHMTQ